MIFKHRLHPHIGRSLIPEQTVQGLAAPFICQPGFNAQAVGFLIFQHLLLPEAQLFYAASLPHGLARGKGSVVLVSRQFNLHQAVHSGRLVRPLLLRQGCGAKQQSHLAGLIRLIAGGHISQHMPGNLSFHLRKFLLK